MNISQIWQETIENVPDEPIDLRPRTSKILDNFSKQKRYVENETKMYRKIWNSLTEEQKKKVEDDAAEIRKTRPLPNSYFTKLVVMYELLDKIKGV